MNIDKHLQKKDKRKHEIEKLPQHSREMQKAHGVPERREKQLLQHPQYPQRPQQPQFSQITQYSQRPQNTQYSQRPQQAQYLQRPQHPQQAQAQYPQRPQHPQYPLRPLRRQYPRQQHPQQTNIKDDNNENMLTAEEPEEKLDQSAKSTLADEKSKIVRKTKLNLLELIKKHLLAGSTRMEYEPDELFQLLVLAKESFQKTCTLIEVPCPVNICGDIHGQYGDLMRIFSSCGLPFKKRYLFLGDYVDRGRHPLEVIVLLFALKIQFPKSVFLLRGNHELFHINKTYGFAAEIRTRYRIQTEAQEIYNHFNEVFAEMPLAALVQGKILCMHGGLSPELNHLNDIRNIQRPIRFAKGLACDLLWADPEVGADGFKKNSIRGVSYVFGENAVKEKLKQLGIDLVIRAHQVVEYGYAFFANRRLITVFSASRYHEELCNFAAVVIVDEHLELSFLQLKPAEYVQRRDDDRVPTADVEEVLDEA